MGFQNPLIPRQVRVAQLTNDTAVAAGATQEILLNPPAGWIYNIVGLDIAVPGIGASGDHSLNVSTEAEGVREFVRHLRGKSNFGTAIEFRWSHWQSADSVALPSDGAAQLASVRGLVADENRNLLFLYANNTDVEQAAESIAINVLVEAVRVDQR